MTSVAFIGDTSDAQFAPLIQWIRTEFPSVETTSFRDIAAWETEQASRQHHQLTLVLQSFSDQFSPLDVERLVGETLFSGLFCCFGAWCEGDGRTHQIWPHSARVSLRYARQLVRAEIRRIIAGLPALPPTAARDEVFLHRQTLHEAKRSHQLRTALVVSPDRVYRATLAQVLTLSGWKAADTGLDSTPSPPIPSPDLLLHDLDPQGTAITESLDRWTARFPRASCCGLANLPANVCSLAGTGVPVIPKLDPFLAIAQVLEATENTDRW